MYRPDTVRSPPIIFFNGAKVVLKTSKKKLLPKEVSVAQWIGANQRIMAKLFPLFNKSELVEYMDFTEQMSDLFVQYPTPNVMRVDDMHRKDVSQKGRKWNDIRIFLQIHWLSLKEDSNPKADKTDKAPKEEKYPKKLDRFQNRQERRLCIQYNKTGSCNFGTSCRFIHACGVPGCPEKHPTCKHELQSPNFRA